MFQFVTDTVTGIGNLVGSVTSGAGQAFGSFFPTPQKQVPITSQITRQVITDPSINYRPTAPDAPSLAETAKYAYNNWFGSPYQDQYGEVATTVRTAGETPGLLDPWSDAAGKLWEAATGAFSKINTQLPEVLMQRWGLSGQPDPQNTGGEVVYQIWGSPEMAPETVPAGQSGQPAGLFSLGFPNWGAAPAVRIPGTQQTIGAGTIGIAAIALMVIIFLSKK